jgi:hypothetical protein
MMPFIEPGRVTPRIINAKIIIYGNMAVTYETLPRDCMPLTKAKKANIQHINKAIVNLTFKLIGLSIPADISRTKLLKIKGIFSSQH